MTELMREMSVPAVRISDTALHYLAWLRDHRHRRVAWLDTEQGADSHIAVAGHDGTIVVPRAVHREVALYLRAADYVAPPDVAGQRTFAPTPQGLALLRMHGL